LVLTHEEMICLLNLGGVTREGQLMLVIEWQKSKDSCVGSNSSSASINSCLFAATHLWQKLSMLSSIWSQSLELCSPAHFAHNGLFFAELSSVPNFKAVEGGEKEKLLQLSFWM